MSSLSRKHGEATTWKLFRLAQHRGILQMTANGRYAMPNPAMRDWLVEGYGSWWEQFLTS